MNRVEVSYETTIEIISFGDFRIGVIGFTPKSVIILSQARADHVAHNANA